MSIDQGSINWGVQYIFEYQRKSNQAIREQVEQQKTRDLVDRSKRSIGDQVIVNQSVSVLDRVIRSKGLGSELILLDQICAQVIGE